MPTPCSRFDSSTARARSTIACETSVSGSVRTIGSPSSARAASCGSNGMRARSGASISAASAAPPPGAEELLAGAAQVRHVLDHAEQAHVRLARHLRGADGDLLRGAVRRRDDERLGAREQLPERDRYVAGAGRHVDDEHVQLAPVDVREELLERAVQHRAAPHDWRVVVEEEPDRHHLQVALDRTGGTIILSTATGRWWMPSMCGIE